VLTWIVPLDPAAVTSKIDAAEAKVAPVHTSPTAANNLTLRFINLSLFPNGGVRRISAPRFNTVTRVI
jgi:hypothetical protein